VPQSSNTKATLIGAAIAAGAAWAAHKAVDQIWVASSGHKPPRADDEGDAALAEILVAAAVTGAVISIVRVLATRGAARIGSR